ncbi:DNA-3-methyladenine glycosylase I [Vibrio europaeus]|uniref:DNA-3-methyladenine glycosylase I n=1 Tax=Vibrio europaeus TaxID=300876 RepID=UPI00233E987E|nr:DNA-3-methyladenine glycosylase I [Vibrio europaeus]MDC5818666.1 DNA-3-methyladenine glycosylase I [Vibrio europaeus]MDC5871311.1 DNA-3-methyladenine glycosylase I [Vibrio europaeus]
MANVQKGGDGKLRCYWCLTSPELMNYHDEDWGLADQDDFKLFEKICLESFQSGLSWSTILRKRDGFRKAFANFNYDVVANYTEADVTRLMADKDIVRHRGKIEAAINNARCVQKMVKEYGCLTDYFWRYEVPTNSVPDSDDVSQAAILSKDLKKRGWKFVGPTTVYAFMQAIGLVNDHAEDCEFRNAHDHARMVARNKLKQAAIKQCENSPH